MLTLTSKFVEGRAVGKPRHLSGKHIDVESLEAKNSCCDQQVVSLCSQNWWGNWWGTWFFETWRLGFESFFILVCWYRAIFHHLHGKCCLIEDSFIINLPTRPQTNIAPENSPFQKESILPTMFKGELLVLGKVHLSQTKAVFFQISAADVFRCSISAPSLTK